MFLLTQIRRLGLVFNPVSFYICISDEGHIFSLSEIENTPWGERHCYVHKFPLNTNTASFNFRKEFHVSPFLPMDIEYNWTFKISAQNIKITMDCFRNDQHCFVASLDLHKDQDFKDRRDDIGRTDRFMTFKIMFFIYYQALKLWLKKVPFIKHPDPLSRRGW